MLLYFLRMSKTPTEFPLPSWEIERSEIRRRVRERGLKIRSSETCFAFKTHNLERLPCEPLLQ